MLTIAVCMVAFLVQLWGILSSFVHPTLTNTRVEEVSFKDIDFPFVIKICIEPTMNRSAIVEAGYEKPIDFQMGVNKFNSTVVGWAGLTKDSTVWGSVEQLMKNIRGNNIAHLGSHSREQAPKNTTK